MDIQILLMTFKTALFPPRTNAVTLAALQKAENGTESSTNSHKE